MSTFYDQKNNRLVVIHEQTSPDYWDKQWNVENLRQPIKSVRDGVYVHKITKKYLSPGSKILEGGCGKGHYVYALRRWGYSAYGVDTAKQTITRVKELFPELPVQVGDVGHLPFSDNYFQGYWSFGVIEHFYNGYDEILSEMIRVIGHNGYLFITFPHLSKLRRWKIKKNKYAPWIESNELRDKFYQFILDEEEVINKFKQRGLRLLEKHCLDGVKGLKDELKIGNNIFKKLYNTQNTFGKIVRYFLNRLFRSWSSHVILLVFQVKKN